MKSKEMMPVEKNSPSIEDVDNNEEKKENTTEDKIDRIDEIFDELLDKVKDAPEAKQEALKILIQQMKQIGEQMKHVRDMNNLQEMKKLMMKHWEELNELADGDQELLKTIQSWGEKFVDEKIIYYELIEDVKDELIEKAQEIQESWGDVSIELGEICGLLEHKGSTIMNLYINQSNEPFIFKSGVEKYIENLTASETGHDDSDLMIDQANGFLENLNGVIMRLSEEAQSKAFKVVEVESEEIIPGIKRPGSDQKTIKGRYIELYPEIRDLLNILKGKKEIISKKIKEASGIFKVVKKVRDTHFLKLYNEQAGEIAA